MIYLYLALGGALGTLARFGISGWIQNQIAADFPWGTFVVNVAGCLLLGFLYRASSTLISDEALRGFLTVGFCGAFTTFSTFSVEAVALLERGAWARAGLYVFGSVGVGLVAVVIGIQLAEPLARTAAG